MAKPAREAAVVIPSNPLRLKKPIPKPRKNFGLSVPGTLSMTGWKLPAGLSEEKWVAAGLVAGAAEAAVQWWLGDWWAYGEHAYGERKALFEEGEPLEDISFQTVANYGWVANAVTTSVRTEVLSWKHHQVVAPLSPTQQRKWLALAIKGDIDSNTGKRKQWSANELKRQIAEALAVARTAAIEFNAKALGKYAVLYADPPWKYEHPPMGGSNRSIENHYQTMPLEEICALPVGDIAHRDCVLFMWATSPKLQECMQVLTAWGFENRTTMVWVKDKIGMGYHVREKHEILLIAKRGELPPPIPKARPESVVDKPRLKHSAKPPVFYDLIDRMYPKMRKIELFGRDCAERKLWTFWGNQAEAQNEQSGRRGKKKNNKGANGRVAGGSSVRA